VRSEASPPPRASGWSACYAPHSTLYFDQRGRVRACCQNTGGQLGDISRQSIREIWDGADAERLRVALEADDLGEGCEFCDWQAYEGNEEVVFARTYDALRPLERRPTWPQRLELALTNTCNLQCTMCSGEWSSAIRSQREHLPPLPPAYGKPFFAELGAFLPHLTSIQIAGGEPFLGREALRVLEMVAELPSPPRVSIITNATTWSPRVQALTRALRPDIIASIDGATAKTYDAIRIGAHLPDTLANLDRFIALLGPDKVSITTCLMTSNWHEFHLTLGLAEARGLEVGVNVVRLPAEQSLYQLPVDDLAAVVATMGATHADLTGPRAAAWAEHREALARHLQVLRSGADVGVPGTVASRWPWLPFPEQAAAWTPPPDPTTEPEVRFTVDTTGHLVLERCDPEVGLACEDLDGAHVAKLTERMAEQFGDPAGWPLAGRRRPDDDDRFWAWLTVRGDPDPTGTHEFTGVARRNVDGHLLGATLTLRRRSRSRGAEWT